jgi:hypothetical protein
MSKKSRLVWPITLVSILLLFLAPFSRPASAYQQRVGRLIIKNGELEVMVTDTDAAVDAALGLAITFDSYVLRQRVWDGEDRRYRHAVITFGMAVDDFEGLLQALKTLGTVLNETASGQDVGDERRDLDSRLSNLYETQTRMRGFLDRATDITETLKVHQELVGIEGEIGEAQGQINFLIDRAGSATLTLSLVPFTPTPTPSSTLTPTPTVTPTPTATPTGIPTPEFWRPGDTAETAMVRLQNTAQKTADFTIYRAIVCGPWLILMFLLGYVIRLAARRAGRRVTWRPPAMPERRGSEEEE